MGKSILAKGKDVKEALDNALILLEAEKDEVDIEIIHSETKGFFGVGAKQAEVRVILREKDNKKEVLEASHSNEGMKEVMAILNAVDEIQVESSGRSSNRENFEESYQSTEKLLGKAWTTDGQVLFRNTKDRYAIVVPGKGMKLFVNTISINQPTVLNDGDHVQVVMNNETIDPIWEIQINKTMTEVRLVIIQPGVKINRTLKNIKPSAYLQLEAENRKRIYPINQSLVVEKLKELQVQVGINYKEIDRACLSEVGGSFVIAVGDEPKQGNDGFFIPNIELNMKKGLMESSDGKVDFREFQQFAAVERGQVIGILAPPVQGNPGQTVTGDIILPKDVFPLQVELGKGVILIDGIKIVVTESGQPSLKIKGRIAKVSIISKLVIAKDVNMETGNIRYIGDVEIGGSIEDTMLVDAKGNVSVRANVNKAKLSAGQSIVVGRNIISSEIIAGVSSIHLTQLSQQLEELLEMMRQMIKAIRQVGSVSAFKVSTFSRTGLGPLIKILCEGKFNTFMALAHSICNKIKSEEGSLDGDWEELAESIESGFIKIVSSNLQSDEDIERIISMGEELIEEAKLLQETDNSFIQIGFAQHSRLYASGDVHIIGQGCYNTIIYAGGKVRIKGAFRGGEIFGNAGVKLDEAGTRGGSMTKIMVPADQTIQIKLALMDTFIQIGIVSHQFLQETTNVSARLDKNGKLQLHEGGSI